jgi:hypothetical protein
MRDYAVWTGTKGVARSETMIRRIFATLWARPTGVQRKTPRLICSAVLSQRVLPMAYAF